MYEANYSKEIYVTVLDEMNIARVEYYFAEFLSLLELPNPEGRYIDVVSDKWDNDPKLLKKGQLKLPENMWFIGTANNDDSTFAISDKVYDRAMIMNLDKKTQVFYAEDTEGLKITYERFSKLISKAKREYGITGRKLRQVKNLDKYMITNFHITFGNRIMKQLKEYVSSYIACGGSEDEAIDDMIAKKIMRKLETQNPVYVRNAIDGLCAYIDEEFGEDKLTLTKEYLRHLERTI
jgi:5-methylcytosine-specific restriction endonuclease McrBC GTP-binding regulatory subunit McrB